MDAIQKGWFSEKVEGDAFSLEVEKVLHCETTKFQDITVFKKWEKTIAKTLVCHKPNQANLICPYQCSAVLS